MIDPEMTDPVGATKMKAPVRTLGERYWLASRQTGDDNGHETSPGPIVETGEIDTIEPMREIKVW